MFSVYDREVISVLFDKLNNLIKKGKFGLVVCIMRKEITVDLVSQG